MTNTHTWSGASFGFVNIMDGTITSTFLAGLNAGGGFAGHTDWRIPNLHELGTLANYENAAPAVDAAFSDTNCVPTCTVTTCSCTEGEYWSPTTVVFAPKLAWFANITSGGLDFDTSRLKTSYLAARAVRGGS